MIPHSLVGWVLVIAMYLVLFFVGLPALKHLVKGGRR